MPYSHSETVSVLTAHYQFLTTYLPHLSPSDLRLPPPGGWPGITSESLSRLNKNEAVINLLKHIPYISSHSGHGHFAPDVTLIDYPFWIEVYEREGDKVRPLGHVAIEEVLPPHVVVLTRGDNYSTHLLLDTERGTITDWSMYHLIMNPETGRCYQDHEISRSELWRHHHTESIQSYFQERERKFLDLDWIPRIGGNARGIQERPSMRPDAFLNFTAEIYRVFGWPDLATFDRDGCRTVVVELEERKRDEYLQKETRRPARARPPMKTEDRDRFDWAVGVACKSIEERERVRLEEIAEAERREREEDAADENYAPSEDGSEDGSLGDLDEEMVDAPGWVEVLDDDDYYEFAEQDNDSEDVETDLQFLNQARAAGEVTSLFGQQTEHVDLALRWNE